MDVEDGSGRTKLVEPIDGSGGIKHQLDLVDVSASSKNLEDLDGSDKMEFSTPHMSPLSSSSSSSSSLDLPTNQLQEEINEFTKSETHISFPPEHVADTQPTIEEDETSVSSDSSSKSEENDISPLDPGLTSPASDVILESKVHGMPSPPVQTMERFGGYDPHRIPSSVFEISKSTTPMEWSVASTESLFSIHVGNSSFSRDNLYLSNDLNKSQELTKSGELMMFSPPLPVPAPALEIERESPQVNESAAVEVLKEIKVAAPKRTAEGSPVKEAPVSLTVCSNSSNNSHHSDESAASTRSFAFPIKKKKKCAWRSCYCSNCSWAFCYFRWPRCHFARPRCHFSWPSCNCSNCSRAFCYGWNCSKIRMCCKSPSILPGGMKNESMRPETEQQHPQMLPAKGTSKSAVKRWFPCLSWCPRPWGCSWRRYCCTCC